MAGRKTYFTVGGKALKPDTNFRSVAPGKFTKGSTGRKPILGNQTRINEDMTDITLRQT